MKKLLTITVLAIAFALGFIACQEDEELVEPSNSSSYTWLEATDIITYIEFPDVFRFENAVIFKESNGLYIIDDLSGSQVFRHKDYSSRISINNNKLYYFSDSTYNFGANNINRVLVTNNGNSFNQLSINSNTGILEGRYFQVLNGYVYGVGYRESWYDGPIIHRYISKYEITSTDINFISKNYYYSEDNSQTINVNGLERISGKLFSDGNYIYTSDDEGIKKSQDGLNWEPAGFEGDGEYGGLIQYSSELHCIHDGNLFKVENGNASLITTLPSDIRDYHIRFVYGDEILGYVDNDQANPDTMDIVKYSNDGGESWEEIDLNIQGTNAWYTGYANVEGLFFSDEYIFVSTMFGMYYIVKPN